MLRRRFLGAMMVALLGVMSVTGDAAEQASIKDHRVVIQVTSDDPGPMNVALGNAINAQNYYSAKGESFTIEIVTYGPGIAMLRDDLSPVKDRIAEAKRLVPNLTLSMCNNSKTMAEQREGRTIPVLASARVVPAGIVRVIELQESGYS